MIHTFFFIRLEAGLLKAQAIIDKKQSQIDVKVKERDELIIARDGAGIYYILFLLSFFFPATSFDK